LASIQFHELSGQDRYDFDYQLCAIAKQISDNNEKERFFVPLENPTSEYGEKKTFD